VREAVGHDEVEAQRASEGDPEGAALITVDDTSDSERRNDDRGSKHCRLRRKAARRIDRAADCGLLTTRR